MGREPRSYHPDGIYHLTQHGIDTRPIFQDDNDRQDFTIRLARVVKSERWDVHAACLMDTHYHLMIQPLTGRVSEGMRNLHGGYARAFNKRHGRRGAVFEARYRERTIRDEAHFGAAIQYIEWNIVLANVVIVATDWPWTTAWDSPFKRCLTPNGVRHR
jgi:REP element-mobilizing transposase RayT